MKKFVILLILILIEPITFTDSMIHIEARESTSVVNTNYQQPGVYYTPTGQFQQLNGQVNELTDIMRNNIRLGLERGQNLDDLQIKAEDLDYNSQQFSRSAHQVHRKYWWKNVTMWIIIIIIVIIVIVLIVVLSVLAAKNKI